MVSLVARKHVESHVKSSVSCLETSDMLPSCHVGIQETIRPCFDVEECAAKERPQACFECFSHVISPMVHRRPINPYSFKLYLPAVKT